MATVHQRADGTRIGYLKGAVEEVLARCGDGVDRDAVSHRQRELASGGLRVLAFASFTPTAARIASQVDGPTETFLGLQAMHDPPREQAVRAVAACREAGIPGQDDHRGPRGHRAGDRGGGRCRRLGCGGRRVRAGVAGAETRPGAALQDQGHVTYLPAMYALGAGVVAFVLVETDKAFRRVRH